MLSNCSSNTFDNNMRTLQYDRLHITILRAFDQCSANSKCNSTGFITPIQHTMDLQSGFVVVNIGSIGKRFISVIGF